MPGRREITTTNGLREEPQQSGASALADRVHAVLVAAERAAETIRSEAEREAQQRLEAADEEAQRLLAEADGRAEAIIREHVEPVQRALIDAAERASELISGLAAAESLRDELAPMIAELRGSDVGLEQEVPRRRSPVEQFDKARHRALELAMAGRTRGEVERDLVDIAEDPQRILDDIFGSGTASTAHIPWSQPSEAPVPGNS